jgi:hypothetical protein
MSFRELAICRADALRPVSFGCASVPGWLAAAAHTAPCMHATFWWRRGAPHPAAAFFRLSAPRRALALEHAAKLHANVTDGANQRSVQLRGRLRRKFQDRSESIPFQNRKTHRARESGVFPLLQPVFEDKFIRQAPVEHFGSLPKALESMSVAKIPNGVGHKLRRGVFIGNKQAAHGPTDLLTYLPEAHLRGTRGGDRTVDGPNNHMQEPEYGSRSIALPRRFPVDPKRSPCGSDPEDPSSTAREMFRL